jgi:hypothetical protein
MAANYTEATKTTALNLSHHPRAVQLPPPAHFPVVPFSRVAILFTVMLVVIILVNDHCFRH